MPLPNQKASHEEAQQQFTQSKCKYVQPIATVFFRFSHRSKKNVPITNQEQKQIVDDIYLKMTSYLDRETHKQALSPGGRQRAATASDDC